jgi:phosphate transport system permease protein
MNLSARAVERFFFFSALCGAAACLLILGFLLYLGRPVLRGDFLLHLLADPWCPDRGLYGIGAMLAGTLFIALLGLFLALPASLGSAILIAVFRPRFWGRLLEKTVQFMAGLPTVVLGFVGVFLLVPWLREHFEAGSGRCVLAAAIGLALLLTPTLVLFFCDAFRRVPKSWLRAGAALGCTRSELFFHIVLPHSRRGLAAGVILAFGRAVGDTMIPLMLAGNAVAAPSSPLAPARTLTAQIALLFAADFDSREFKIIFACGLLLYLISLTATLLVRALSRDFGRDPDGCPKNVER